MNDLKKDNSNKKDDLLQIKDHNNKLIAESKILQSRYLNFQDDFKIMKN